MSEKLDSHEDSQISDPQAFVHVAEDKAIEGLSVRKPARRGNINPLPREQKRFIRAEIARWTFTPEPYRNPSTLKQLGQDLHISYSYAKYIKAKIPKTLSEYMSECEMVAVSRYGFVCETLADRAKAGDKDAAKLIATEMVKPLKSLQSETRRPQTPRGMAQMPESIARAFQMIEEAKKQARLKKQETENQVVIAEKQGTPALASVSSSESGVAVNIAPRNTQPNAVPAARLPDSANKICPRSQELGPAYERGRYDEVPRRLN